MKKYYYLMVAMMMAAFTMNPKVIMSTITSSSQ